MLDVTGIKRIKHPLSEGAMVTMTERHSQHDESLARAVLEIVGYYQPIPTMDIWYELGEDDRFEDGIPLAEVNDILSHLEKRKRIFREDGGKWMVK
jgi:hypothetical protein